MEFVSLSTIFIMLPLHTHNGTELSCWCVCAHVCAFVCVCVCTHEEREGEREIEGMWRGRDLSLCSGNHYVCVGGAVPLGG